MNLKLGLSIAGVICVGSFLLFKKPHARLEVSREEREVASISPATESTGVAAAEAAQQADQNPQMKVLKEILKSGNDNDLRLDRDLKVLSSETKEEMMRYYQTLPREKRNDLGTIVFLMGRNLTDHQDVAFLKSVLAAKPCLSLTNCDASASTVHGEVSHSLGINEISASYPELMAVRALKMRGEEIMSRAELNNGNRTLLEGILDALSFAAHSSNPRVAHSAEVALKHLPQY